MRSATLRHFLFFSCLTAWGVTAFALPVDSRSAPPSGFVLTDSQQGRLNEAQDALQAGLFDKAEKIFLEINRLNPKAVEALIGLSMVAQTQNKPERAREWMANAVAAAPGKPAILQAQARLLVEQGNPAAAVDSYRKAIAAHPEVHQIRLDLAALYLERLKKPAEAVAVLRDLLKLNPSSPEANLSLGLALSADGKMEQAIKSLNEATRLDPNNPLASHALGLVELKQGNAERALAAFDRALTLRPSFVGPAIGRADALAALGKVDKALAAYQNAAVLAPRSAVPHAMKAKLLERQKRLDDAELAYRDALQAEPGHAVVMNNLAYLLASRKIKLDEAVALAQRAIAADPGKAGFFDTLGTAQLAKGDAVSARKSFEKALAMSPGNAAYREHLAQASSEPSKPVLAPVSAPAVQAPAAVAATPVVVAPAAAPVPAPVPAKVAVAPVAVSAPAVAPNPPAKQPAEDPAKVIGPQLEAWRQAWESKDVARYLSFYSKDFAPPAKKTRAAWEADRRIKLEKNGDIQVRVQNPVFMLSGNVATVVFDQQYQSSNFKDATGKRLEWIKEGNDWRIRSEGAR